jgi:hypothetical protein
MLRIQVLLQIVTPRTGNLLSGAIAPGLDQAIPVGVARELHSKQRCSLINRADIIFSYLNIVWLVYVASGDLDFLAESYPAIKRYAVRAQRVLRNLNLQHTQIHPLHVLVA